MLIIGCAKLKNEYEKEKTALRPASFDFAGQEHEIKTNSEVIAIWGLKMKNKGYEFSYNICSKANQEKLLVDVNGSLIQMKVTVSKKLLAILKMQSVPQNLF
ncbi:MAG: hypothetical protein IJ306_07110 [Oscillospiraceae bacterium]|nr:hypothetical protein [Oscillospiraceae bacterium]